MESQARRQRSSDARTEDKEFKTMAVITNPMLALPAAMALLVLTQTAGECGFNPEMKFTNAGPQSGAEKPKGPAGGPALLHVGTPKDEQDAVEAPLSCLQIQAIDEIELVAEPTPAADCD
jgi:hypothetical protein